MTSHAPTPPRALDPTDDLTPADSDRAMRLILMDGLTTQVMATLTGGVFLTGYALSLGASNLVVGLLASIPFLAQLVQLPAILLVEKVRLRKLLTVTASGASRLVLLSIAFAPFLPPHLALAQLVVVLAVAAALGSAAACSWNSWIRDVLPMDRLGRYFGLRMFAMTFLGVVVSFGAGMAIDAWSPQLPIYNIFFGIGAVAGLLGAWLLSRTPEPRMPPDPGHPSLKSLLAQPYADSNFRKLMLFLGSWSFAVNLATPFFTVYMLERLELSMADVITLTVFSQVCHMAFLGTWGRLADRLSNRAVLAVCGSLYILCLLGWTFTTFPERHDLTVPLLFALHGLMGVSMAGVTLASGNIALKLSPARKATPYLAMNGMISSLSAGIAPIFGGSLADFFSNRELRLTLTWDGPGEFLSFDTLSFQAWDFFFIFACMIGLYSLHRLGFVNEGERVQTGTFIRHYFVERRRAYTNLSTIAGLRWLAAIPAGELLREHENRPTMGPEGD